MKTTQKFLNGLNADTKNYKVKVKVIEKGRPKTSSKKGTVYQTLLLEDDKGNKMRGALFGDQVDAYKDTIVYNGIYEIADAPLKPCNPQWKSAPDEMNFQMSFGQQTIIQFVEAESGPRIPQYKPLTQILKDGPNLEKFDVIGIVLYVEKTAKEVLMADNRAILVREIVVADHSSEQPLIISAWGDLAETECNNSLSAKTKFKPVGFTALKTATHKGFSLSTTMSTTITHDPQGEKAKALHDWAATHNHLLNDMEARVVDARQDPKQKKTATIRELSKKKIKTTLQEERLWLQVSLCPTDLSKLNAYIGCSKCGKSNDLPLGETFKCHNCSKNDCIASAKVSMTCEVSDNTDNLPITAFNEDVERIINMPIPDIFKMVHSEDHETFNRALARTSDNKFLVEVGPKVSLHRNKILQWGLKKVIIEPQKNTPTQP